MSANALAKALNVPAPRINDVVRERRGISADTAMWLARYFGGDAHSWLNLQTAFDLRVAESVAPSGSREKLPQLLLQGNPSACSGFSLVAMSSLFAAIG